MDYATDSNTPPGTPGPIRPPQPLPQVPVFPPAPVVPPAPANHEDLVKIMGSIAGAACGIIFLGAFFGGAWPAAVACCGLSFMGAVVAYFMLRNG